MSSRSLRIQTSPNGGFAPRRKGRYAPLSAVACGPALTPLRSKDAPAAIGGIESPCLEKTQSSSRRVEAIPAFICYKETTALLRIGSLIDTSPPNGNCVRTKCFHMESIKINNLQNVFTYVNGCLPV